MRFGVPAAIAGVLIIIMAVNGTWQKVFADLFNAAPASGLKPDNGVTSPGSAPASWGTPTGTTTGGTGPKGGGVVNWQGIPYGPNLATVYGSMLRPGMPGSGMTVQ